jgi:hypothetical protein
VCVWLIDTTGSYPVHWYIVPFPDPRQIRTSSCNSPSHLGGHSEGRRDGLPKALDVGEVSIVTGSRRRSIHPVAD